MGGLFIFFLIFFLYYYRKGAFDGFIEQIKNQNQSNVVQQNIEQPKKLSFEEQEALKQRIRERAKNPDPRNMPKEAKIFTSEDIENYHDALDSCDRDDCDVNLSNQNKTFKENCHNDGCDLDDKLSSVEEQNSSNLPLVYQLAIAEAILYRKGK